MKLYYMRLEDNLGEIAAKGIVRASNYKTAYAFMLGFYSDQAIDLSGVIVEFHTFLIRDVTELKPILIKVKEI